jgi:hypothetical protein
MVQVFISYSHEDEAFVVDDVPYAERRAVTPATVAARLERLIAGRLRPIGASADAADKRIFVSHSHKDNDFGVRLVEDLRTALGGGDETVWYDASGGLHGGDAWWRTIVAEIKARPVFIVVASPESMASP